MSTTQFAMLTEVQYVMLEPPTDGTTWPSGMWTYEEILDYISQRQNRFIKETHIELGIDEVGFDAEDPEGFLPPDWVASIRAIWIGDDDTVKVLVKGDAWIADHGYPTWETTPGTPKLYMDHGGSETLTMSLAPMPDVDGLVRIYYVPTAPALNVEEDTLTVPDDFVWAVKYGTMADMFRKIGLNQDADRAEYCESRYQMGVEVAQILLEGWD